MGLGKYRNQPCPCGSGMKFKYCCLQRYHDMQAQVVTPLQKLEQNRMAAKRYEGAKQYEN